MGHYPSRRPVRPPRREYRAPVWETLKPILIIALILAVGAVAGGSIGYFVGLSRCPDCSKQVAMGKVATPTATQAASPSPSPSAMATATVVRAATATVVAKSSPVAITATRMATPEPGWESAKEAKVEMTFVIPESIRLSADGKRLLVWGIFIPPDKDGKANLGQKSKVMEARWYPLCAELSPAFAPEIKDFSDEAYRKPVRIDYARVNGATLTVLLHVVGTDWVITDDAPFWKCLGEGVTEIK